MDLIFEYNSIESDIFVWFIKIMNKWLNSHNNFGYDNINLLIDNCSFHKATKHKIFLRNLPTKYTTLQSITQKTPIEMCFILIKRTLSERWKHERIKLSFKHNFIKIHNSLQSLTGNITRRMLGKFIKILKQYLFVKFYWDSLRF